ncbi:TetR family transcriptional regulator [Leifsonia xyli subsp. cynodontis DSM 46306]|uniref:Glycoside hydrolase family 2 n=1 Tax=Leifsonia xyli subsp. cynodontis DSM 46306 TaxID=1389489 RepID=U3P3W0_LEIXC|nr:glycoside hydrolase family 2 [Leifsonia xyli]AGW40990.1 TetR family transcriptional regulator [Leifsonia xyli subsp. cynodontis DSM 46306]
MPGGEAALAEGVLQTLKGDAALDGGHPRPQALRSAWAELDGEWEFAFDDTDSGLSERWQESCAFPLSIRVPFPFESELSGIGDTGYHPVVWYARDLTPGELSRAGHESGRRLMLRFGAVDYRCRVWVDGHLLGEHEGGHTPFAFDATDALDAGRATHRIVVRVEDDPLDVAQPRGKQEWLPEPHAIWYQRTSGIWQPVWLEAVDELHLRTLHWTPDVPRGEVRLELELSRRPASPAAVTVAIGRDGEALARVSATVTDQRAEIVIPIPAQRNGQAHEELLWHPGSPVLLDATVTLDADGRRRDAVASYFGMRSTAVRGGEFVLNDRQLYLRSVLYQGYWTESHLASPSASALRADVELIAELGFNAVRIHQKIEDPRFLHWTDRLGILVWGEAPGAYEFGPRALQRTTSEWLATLERDRSHPPIVTWVLAQRELGCAAHRRQPRAARVRPRARGAHPGGRPHPSHHLERRLGARRLRHADAARLRGRPRRRLRPLPRRRGPRTPALGNRTGQPRRRAGRSGDR